MKINLTKPNWTAKKTGVLLGILSFITIFIMHKPLGATSTFIRIYEYLSNSVYHKPLIGWQFMLLVGLLIGSFTSAVMSKTMITSLPSLWTKRFGYSRFKRGILGFSGGVLILFGARLAGGCTLGHAIAGASQMAMASLLFIPIFFISGTISAFLIYGKGK